MNSRNQIVPYGKGPMKRRNKQKSPGLAFEVGKYSAMGLANLVKGIASAFKSAPGASKARVEMRAAVAPLAQSLSLTTSGPKFSNVSGGLALEHTESLDASGQRFEQVVSTDIFRWLGPVASGFEEYRIKLEYGWVPTCPATSTGRVMMAFDYDPTDSVGYGVTDVSDYLNTQDHCVGAIWAPAAISPTMSGWLKTGSDGDPRLYSPGRVQMACENFANGITMVRYRVEFRKAQPQSFLRSYVQTGTYGATDDPFGKIIDASGPSPFRITDSRITQVVPGRYIVYWSTDGTPTFTTVAGARAAWSTITTGSSGRALFYYTNAVGEYIEFQTSAPGGLTAYQLVINPTQAPPLYWMSA